MRLIYSPTSPYARKVRMVALEKRIPLDLQSANPMADNSTITPLNPLGKVPTLIIDTTHQLYDSPVICAYLDDLNRTPQLIPQGDARWQVLCQEALTDGMLDAALSMVTELKRPLEEQSLSWLKHWQAAILRSAQHVESDLNAYTGPLTLGQLALGATLGYLDFRLPQLEWRQGCTQLADWYTEFAQRPSMQDTQPPTT
ncbi:glutathione S-transferase N-terminal domain-containing protein [Magnetococcus sp. PR-3]|uniref:glutathione S-transferase N-terminal domain-containing protein n=1 Tax=Magnetococcus sp. PR-3 TaxID=3120355 RepID=UPI002FCDE44D